MAQKSNSAQTLTIDLQTILIPGAILVAGLMVSLSVFFGVRSLRGNLVSTDGSPSVLAETGDTNDNAVAPTQEAVPRPTDKASTSIDDDPFLGDKSKAKVAVVEFTDYECPFCSRHHNDTFKQIVENYVDTGKAIYVSRDLPLSFHDPAATREAIAAECVQDLGGDGTFFSYIDKIFNESAGNGAGLSDDRLAQLASDVGVNKGDFESCLSDERFADEVKADLEAAGAAGITGTPGFVVGRLMDDGTVEGIRIAGAYPYQTFADAIEDLL